MHPANQMDSDFCNHTKEVKVTWGKDKRQTADVCVNCAIVIFETVKPQVAAGILPYIIEPLY